LSFPVCSVDVLYLYRNDKSRLISLPSSIQHCNSVCLKCGQGNLTDAMKSDAKQCLTSTLLEQIRSVVTQNTKCSDHSQIYNICFKCQIHKNNVIVNSIFNPFVIHEHIMHIFHLTLTLFIVFHVCDRQLNYLWMNISKKQPASILHSSFISKKRWKSIKWGAFYLFIA